MARRGHNEGSIYKRSDGRWVASLTLGDGSGKRREFYGKTRQEVVRRLAEAKRDLDAGIPLGDEIQTVGKYLDSWLTAARPPHVDERTWMGYEQHVRNHLIPGLGAVRRASRTAQRVQEFYGEKLLGGLASTTVHHIHSTLHAALEAAVRLGVVGRNVTDYVDAPPVRTKEMHPLSRDKARALPAASAGHRLEAFFVLAVATGMREDELMGLTWANVDAEAGVVRVRQSVQRPKGGGWRFKVPKTKRSRRQIAVSDEVMAVLHAHRARQLQERLLVGPAWTDLDLVFPPMVGTPLSPRTLLYRTFRPLLVKAGIVDPAGVRIHDLRHTAATPALGGRVNPKVVSEMLGHASVAITLDLYSHVVPDMQQDAAPVMGRLLFGPKGLRGDEQDGEGEEERRDRAREPRRGARQPSRDCWWVTGSRECRQMF